MGVNCVNCDDVTCSYVFMKGAVFTLALHIYININNIIFLLIIDVQKFLLNLFLSENTYLFL